MKQYFAGPGGFIKIYLPELSKDVSDWIDTNCQDMAYTGNNWGKEGNQKYVVQFVNEKDAMLFALKWVNYTV